MAVKGVNEKAVAARDRKAAAAAQKQEELLRKTEEAKWADNDKVVANKTQRKEEKESKKDLKAQRKAERDELEQEELNQMGASNGGGGGTKAAGKKGGGAKKVTQAEIMRLKLLQSMEAQKQKEALERAEVRGEDLLSPNVNHILRAQRHEALLSGTSFADAGPGIDAALVATGAESPAVDLHPERRMKAAYKAYEERELQALKADFPTLKRSQLLERIHKSWSRSPENPVYAASLLKTTPPI